MSNNEPLCKRIVKKDRGIYINICSEYIISILKSLYGATQTGNVIDEERIIWKNMNESCTIWSRGI